MSKKRVVVICPGRGTYNKTELGFLHKYHSSQKSFVQFIDNYRQNQLSIWELDGRKEFSSKEHLAGENAAALIYACSMLDFLEINRNKIEIVAVAGNSMGWYIACACAGALSKENAIHVINTMGSQMKENIIGGQIIYPEVDEFWRFDSNLSTLIDCKIKEVNAIEGHYAYNSIFFGGYRIIGGNDAALKYLLKNLPLKEGRYPFKLVGNAAFHTPLLTETSQHARAILGMEYFDRPNLPLVDGSGKIWMPYSTEIKELWNYTLGHQVDHTYDFSKSIEVAVKEFAPDHLVITGPGMTLGGAVAQTIINKKLKNIFSKDDFKKMQVLDPYILSMSDSEQRQLVL